MCLGVCVSAYVCMRVCVWECLYIRVDPPMCFCMCVGLWIIFRRHDIYLEFAFYESMPCWIVWNVVDEHSTCDQKVLPPWADCLQRGSWTTQFPKSRWWFGGTPPPLLNLLLFWACRLYAFNEEINDVTREIRHAVAPLRTWIVTWHSIALKRDSL